MFPSLTKCAAVGLLMLAAAAVGPRGVPAAPVPGGPAAKKGPVRLWKHEPNRAGPVAFTADSKALVLGGSGHVYHWESATGKEIRKDVYKTKWTWWAKALSADGKVVGMLEARNKLHVLDTRTGKERCLLAGSPGLYGRSNLAALSADGTLFVAHYVGEAGDLPGHHLRFWDAVTGKEQEALEGRGFSSVRCLAVSPDKKLLAVGREGGTVELIELAGRKAAGALVVPREPHPEAQLRRRRPPSRIAALLSVAFAPDGKTLAAGDNDGNVFLFDVKTRKLLRRLGSGPKPLRDFSVPGISALCFSADGKTLAASDGFLAGKGEGRARLWDVATGKELGSVPAQGKWTYVALSPNGKYLAVAQMSDGASAVEVWDVSGITRR
jgi:WD40 repeat protein